MSVYISVATGNFTAETTWGNTWAAGTAYALGAMVVPTVLTNFAYKCVVAGTSDTVEPTWPTVEGDTVVDGTATWECVSPYPVAGDGFTVSASTIVTYDVGVTTDLYDNITLDGTLTFPSTQNSELWVAGTAAITINLGGALEIGTSTTPIPSTYYAKICFDPGTAARYALVLNDGGALTIYGDPAYYSSTKKLTLASDWDASLGDTLYVQGDQTLTWPVGAKFYLNKGYASGTYAGSTDYQTDGDIFEIATIGAYDSVNDVTPITVVAGHGSLLTFLASQELLVISRNVYLGDLNAPWDVYGYGSYTEYIRFDNNQASGNYNIDVNDCVLHGWDRAIDEGYNFVGNNLCFISNNYGTNSGANHQIIGDFVSNYCGINSGTNHQVTGNFVSNNRGINSGTNYKIAGDFVSNYYGIIYGTNHQVTGNFVSNNRGINSGTNHQIIGDFVSNYYGIIYGTNHQVTGNFVSNNRGINSGTNHKIAGDFVSNNYGINSGTNYQIIGDFVSNNYDFYNAVLSILAQNCDFGDGDITTSITDTNSKRSVIIEDCTLAGASRLPLRIYEATGNILPLVSTDVDWILPPSNNDWELQFLPNSYCADNWVNQLELSPLEYMSGYALTTNTTISFNIYPVGWLTTLTNTDILIEAKYLDSATGNTRTTVQTAAATFTNAVWNTLSVTIAPLQDGIVYFNVFLRRYESGAYVILDPVWSIS